MKKTILIQFFLLLFAFTIVKANKTTDNPPHDKEYFKTFKKNEQPENEQFNLLNKKSNEKVVAYYVVYKENSLGQGFYFKIALDKNEKPIATYYASESGKSLDLSTVQNLKNILKGDPTGKLAPTTSVTETPAQCVTKCHRANNCYGQPTNTGVLLCSLDCQIGCA